MKTMEAKNSFTIEHSNLLHTLWCMLFRGKNSSEYPNSSEADASEFLENIELIFPCTSINHAYMKVRMLSCILAVWKWL